MQTSSRYWVLFGVLACLSGAIILHMSLRSPVHSVESVIQFSVKSGQRGAEPAKTIAYAIPAKLDGTWRMKENTTELFQLTVMLDQARRKSESDAAAKEEAAKSAFLCEDFVATLDGPPNDLSIYNDNPFMIQQGGDCVFKWWVRPKGTGDFVLVPHVTHPFQPAMQGLKASDLKVTTGLAETLQHGLGSILSLVGGLATLKGLITKKSSGKKQLAKRQAKITP
jgi:hypothetical protein